MSHNTNDHDYTNTGDDETYATNDTSFFQNLSEDSYELSISDIIIEVFQSLRPTFEDKDFDPRLPKDLDSDLPLTNIVLEAFWNFRPTFSEGDFDPKLEIKGCENNSTAHCDRSAIEGENCEDDMSLLQELSLIHI